MISKSLARLIKRKRKKTQINKIIDEKGNITIDNKKIQRLIIHFYNNLCSTKL